MNTQKVLTLGFVLLGISLAYYALVAYGLWALCGQKMSATTGEILSVYEAICEYSEKHGQWPKRLLDENGRLLWGHDAYAEDPIFHKPWLYFPDAKRGTNAILLAQPEPIQMRVWPIIIKHRVVIGRRRT